MEEGQVSVDGVTHPLAQPFMVIATQNPVEVQGTFPLPEAQLDRFLISITIGYPDRDQEGRIMQDRAQADPMQGMRPVLTPEEVMEMRSACREVFAAPAVKDYILDIVQATRDHEEILLGASPRASLALLHAAQTRALFNGRDFATPEDVKILAGPVLAHRILLRAATRLNLVNNQAVVAHILSTLPVPAKS